MDRRVNIIAIVSTMIGLLGIADTIWFYATGARSSLPNAAIALNWPSSTLYINLFIPGFVVGLGIRTRENFYRVLGLVLSVIWAVGACYVIVFGVYGLFQAGNPSFIAFGVPAIAFFSGVLGFSVWEFNVLRGSKSLEYFYKLKVDRNVIGIGKKIDIIAIVSTILGLIGIFDTVWFYVTGARSGMLSAALTLGWTSFAIYLNLFVPGIVVGLGIRTQDEAFRIFGLIVSVLWVLVAVFFIVIGAIGLTQSPSMLYGAIAFALMAFGVGFLLFCVWQFNVLRGAESVKYFTYVPTESKVER